MSPLEEEEVHTFLIPSDNRPVFGLAPLANRLKLNLSCHSEIKHLIQNDRRWRHGVVGICT